MPARIFNIEQELWIREQYEREGRSVLEIVRKLDAELGIATSHPVVTHALRRQGVRLRTPSERNLLHYRGSLHQPDPQRLAQAERIRRLRRRLEAQRRRSDVKMTEILEELNCLEKQITEEVA